MSKSGTYMCANCGTQYHKKLIKCPQCNSINERKIAQVAALEIKASHSPDTGLQCKHCGTIFPDDISKCPYCSQAASNAKRLSSVSLPVEIETPTTRYYNKRGYVIRFGSNSLRRRQSDTQLTHCTVCKNSISSDATNCPICGHPTGVQTCPKCGSTQFKIITGASKAASIFLWGPFAAHKVLSRYRCKSCGHKW